ncbi:MAG: hypothetical protein FWD14_02085 [Treponema sp.]|nr:hypothetical protein [Treponema sp.]
MEDNAFYVSLAKNPKIAIKLIPGHFSTSNAHSNNYLDFSELKCNSLVARDVAKELAIPYLSTTIIDTIVCMEKTSAIGAYIAEELVQEGTSVINSGGMIYVVSPMNNAHGNWVFPSNRTEWINGKNILLLTATVSSGRALNSVLECISYYGGKLAGISALYIASPETHRQDINSLFTSDDVTGYKLYSPVDCEMCKNGQKLDAIISSEGYTKIG